MPIRTDRTNTTAPVARTEATRAPPSRIDWELSAMWRAIQMVESDTSSRHGTGLLKEDAVPGWGSNQAAVNTRFREEISPDLKNFIELGKSSMTPYEATRLAFGLGFGGTNHVEPSEKPKGYMRGDRVELSVTRNGTVRTTKGIVVPGGILAVDSNRKYRFYALEYDNGTQGRDKVVINKLLAGALNDGKLEATYG